MIAGPWGIAESNAIFGTFIRDANGFCVATINKPNNQRAKYIDAEESARLVAAAPDMLNALKDIVPDLLVYFAESIDRGADIEWSVHARRRLMNVLEAIKLAEKA